MREKLETLPLAVLRDLAKDKQVKNFSVLKKEDLIDAILATVAEQEQAGDNAPLAEESPVKKPRTAKASRTKKANEQAAGSASADSEISGEDETERAGRRHTARNSAGRRSAKAGAGDALKTDEAADVTEEVTKTAEETANGIDKEVGSDKPSKGIRRIVKKVGTTEPRPHGAKKETEKHSEEDAEAGKTTEAVKTQPAKTQPEDPYKQDFDPLQVDNSADVNGILEVMQEGYGFIRCANYMPGENDIYVSPAQIKRFGLKTGDIIVGSKRLKNQGEKFSALIYIRNVNGYSLQEVAKRVPFEKLTPIFPNERIHLELSSSSTAMRIVDLISPVGKGQRGMIVSQPKAGKTTLLKQIANSITTNNKEMHLIILLIDERPEEVTDIKESIKGDNVDVIYSTFDELPDHHRRVSEMVIERAKRLVEHGQDVCILLDSITRLTRAYNIVVAPSGRTLSGGLDPASLYMPKRFFGAARNMREGGSLTILATALVDTGSKMDDVVYEEFKGTGNMELVLDRKLSERRIFPAIDIVKSGTRREDLLLNREEQEAVDIMRKALSGLKPEDAAERIIDLFSKTRNNAEFCQMIKKVRII